MHVTKLSDYVRGYFIGNFEPSLLRTKDFEVADIAPETIDDEKVTETIDQIRSFFGTWENVEGRARVERLDAASGRGGSGRAPDSRDFEERLTT